MSSDLVIRSSAASIPSLFSQHHVMDKPVVNELTVTGNNPDTTEKTASLRDKPSLRETFKLLLKPQVFIYGIVLCFSNAGNACVYVFFPKFAVNNGATTRQAAQLLSLAGILNLMSRFCTGALTNFDRKASITITFSSFGLVAFALSATPVLGKTLAGQACVASLFGLYANCYVPLMVPITVDALGNIAPEALSLVYGVEVLSCGVGIFCGPPLAGLIYEATGQFDAVFYFVGLMYFLACFVMMVLPCFQSRKATTFQEEPQKDTLKKPPQTPS